MGASGREAAPGPRILIVDDEKDILILLSLVFAGSGYQVQTATHVREAMERCASESFDVVLSDVILPESSGHDLIRWLSVQSPSVVSILMTGLDIDCTDCPQQRGCYYLRKPFHPADALAAVAAALARR